MQFTEQVTNVIIRPARQKYCINDLGPIVLNHFKRIDFKIPNRRQNMIHGSLYIPKNTGKHCVIYCHSSNGSRLQAVPYSQYFAKQQKYFCTFDYSGSGMSEGEFVSLGYHECEDLFSIFKYLLEKHNISEFSLWGRSMGCMCIMRFLSRLKNNLFDQEISEAITILSVVLDSPFANLYNLIIELGKNQSGIPSYFLKVLFSFIEKSLEQKINFKISELNAIELINDFKIPLLVICSKNDSIVSSYHSEFIYNSYKHQQKSLFYIDSDHHQQRSKSTVMRIVQFILSQIKKKDAQEFQQKMVAVKLNVKIQNKQNIEILKKFQISSEKKKQRNYHSRGISSILCERN